MPAEIRSPVLKRSIVEVFWIVGVPLVQILNRLLTLKLFLASLQTAPHTQQERPAAVWDRYRQSDPVGCGSRSNYTCQETKISE